jgi:hypothetical protein
MSALQTLLAELTRLATALAGLYFLVGFVLSLVQSQVAGAAGSSLDRSRALQQGLGMILLLSVAVSIGPLTRSLLPAFYGPGFSPVPPPDSADALITLWSDLAGLVISIAVGSAAVVLSVGAVYAGLGLQIARLLGLPLNLARALGQLLGVLGGLGLSLAAATIGRLLLARILGSG